jgi:hypothetical protein
MLRTSPLRNRTSSYTPLRKELYYNICLDPRSTVPHQALIDWLTPRVKDPTMEPEYVILSMRDLGYIRKIDSGWAPNLDISAAMKLES